MQGIGRQLLALYGICFVVCIVLSLLLAGYIVAPVAPVELLEPVEPAEPGGPMGPVGPVGPVGLVGPVGPGYVHPVYSQVAAVTRAADGRATLELVTGVEDTNGHLVLETGTYRLTTVYETAAVFSGSMPVEIVTEWIVPDEQYTFVPTTDAGLQSCRIERLM
jgi:hypothetical protein